MRLRGVVGTVINVVPIAGAGEGAVHAIFAVALVTLDKTIFVGVKARWFRLPNIHYPSKYLQKETSMSYGQPCIGRNGIGNYNTIFKSIENSITDIHRLDIHKKKKHPYHWFTQLNI